MTDYAVTNPATGETLASFDTFTDAQIDEAVAAENAARSTASGVITAEILRVGDRPAGETPAGSPICAIAAAAVAGVRVWISAMSSVSVT
jgi:hypothetical protein